MRMRPSIVPGSWACTVNFICTGPRDDNMWMRQGMHLPLQVHCISVLLHWTRLGGVQEHWAHCLCWGRSKNKVTQDKPQCWCRFWALQIKSECTGKVTMPRGGQVGPMLDFRHCSSLLWYFTKDHCTWCWLQCGLLITKVFKIYCISHGSDCLNNGYRLAKLLNQFVS